LGKINFRKSDAPNNPNIIADLSMGHHKPIRSDRYLPNNFEFIYHFTKTSPINVDKLAIGVPYQDKSNIRRWKSANNNDKRDCGRIWIMPYETIQSKSERRFHPSTFPVQLPEKCIKLHGAC
jgi:site-specific DNA-methyltransferase (adenine-specific)